MGREKNGEEKSYRERVREKEIDYCWFWYWGHLFDFCPQMALLFESSFKIAVILLSKKVRLEVILKGKN